MNYRELLHLPNLLSLSRILLALVIGYFLWRDDPWSTGMAAVMVIIAGITDGLDGYLARKMNRVTSLGIALDPICDKLFALLLVGGLILFRDFPLWLAAAIVARDLLIVAGGLILKGLLKKVVSDKPAHFPTGNLELPSNLTGKWAFAAIAVLLGAHTIRFDFSIMVMTPVVVVLLAASLFSYGLVFRRITQGRVIKPFADSCGWRVFRYGMLALASGAHAVMFYVEFLK